MTAVILRELSLFFWLNHSFELPPRTLFVIRLQPFSIFAQVARPEDGPLQTPAKHHFGLAIFGISVQNRPEPIRGCQLSSREREVAELLVAGQTYREVGGKLFISAKTVEHHVARIRQRLGASNRSDLLARLRAELAIGS